MEGLLNRQFKRSFNFTVLPLSLVLILSLSGCRHEKPNVIYMPDMVYSPAHKAQQEESVRMPVPGTVSRDYVAYPIGKDPIATGKELKNPLLPTRATLERGKAQFTIHCSVCHGGDGLGGGSIVPKFPRPPSLLSEKIRNYADGSIFHVITVGQNLMPSYDAQVPPPDRWAIIHYIRALQRAKYPTPADLKAFSVEESH